MAKEITVTFPGGKQVDGRMGDQLVHTDQSKKNGGEETGPEPFDLLFYSLATCAGIYALEFCNARDISTEGLGIKLFTERNPEKKMYDLVEIQVTPPEGFPEKYRDALVRSVNMCTVKKHMLDPPVFDVRLAD